MFCEAVKEMTSLLNIDVERIDTMSSKSQWHTTKFSFVNRNKIIFKGKKYMLDLKIGILNCLHRHFTYDIYQFYE